MLIEAVLMAGTLLALQVPDLVEKLRSENIQEREKAERGLIKLGEVARALVEGLLNSSDAELQNRARRILQAWLPNLSADEKKEIDALLLEARVAPEEGADPDVHDFFFVDQKVWNRWTAFGKKPTRYLLELHRESTGLRRGQLLWLAARARDPAVLPASLDGLRSQEPEVRLYAVSACGMIGDPIAVGPLVALLRDHSSVHSGGTGLPDTVSRRAAWAIESLVGFPVDPDLWVEYKFPLDRAHHGMVTRPERIEAWWERNRQWRTREDWRKAAEKDAVALAGSDRPSQERLSGCLLLLMFGGHDDEICRAVFEIYRDARADDEEHWRRRRCLGFLVNESSPWLDFKGRPAKRMESFLLKQLEEEPADKDRTALLGLCWELCSNRSDWLPSFGKVFPLTSLRPILRGTLKSKDPVDRTLAALTLAFLEESEGEEVLCQGLREARAEVPWVATADRWTDRGPNGLSVYLLEALKKLGTTSAQEAIRLHANHSNVRVKVVAWEALARLGDKSILPAIREFLDKRDGEPINMNGLWRDAVDCLYRLDREGALQWCRKEFQGKREFTFFHWLVANLLARNSERLAVELWIASPFDTWSGAWQEIPKIRAEVLIPALLDLIEQGSPQARRGLALFVPQEAAHEKSVQELRAWWRANAATFKITRQNLQDVEK